MSESSACRKIHERSQKITERLLGVYGTAPREVGSIFLIFAGNHL